MTRDELINKVVSYTDKVFFYCVKRCDNKLDAEDLSQTILLECITNINKGTIIENIDYYIWGICKNQFNLYLRNKINKDNITDEYDDTKIKSKELSPLDSLINDEKVKMINASIKLLSSDYSKILYAYYIEDKTIKVIAEELKLPLGTVCRKLKEIRDKLKEYIIMERINGKKAFVPKEFDCRRSGGSPSHNPEQYVSSLINQNILLHSYDNPCTLEDYSLEMGISLPYIENIVEILLDATLLKKTKDNKYLTNFTMIEKAVDKKIHEYMKKNSQEYSSLIATYCKDNINKWKSLLNNELIDDNKLMWSFLFNINHIVEVFGLNKDDKEIMNSFKNRHKFNDGGWDFMMYEKYSKDETPESIDEMCDTSLVGGICAYYYPASETCKIDNGCINTISYDKAANWEADLNVLGFVAHNKDLKYSDCTYTLKTSVDNMINENYLKVVDDKLVFNFPYLDKEKWSINATEIRYDEDLASAKLKRKEITDGIKQLITPYIPEYLHIDLDYIASTYFMGYMRIKVVKYFEEKGLIKAVNENTRFTYNMIAFEK